MLSLRNQIVVCWDLMNDDFYALIIIVIILNWMYRNKMSAITRRTGWPVNTKVEAGTTGVVVAKNGTVANIAPLTINRTIHL